jgi:hypothetical protein
MILKTRRHRLSGNRYRGMQQGRSVSMIGQHAEATLDYWFDG